MKWVTREKIRVNRLATSWLIKRFIDKEAEFIFVKPEQVVEFEAQGYVGFDAPGCKYNHANGVSSFEQLVEAYSITDPAVLEIAKIIHSADIKGKSHLRSESKGIKIISHGIPLVTKDDYESMEKGFFIYDCIYANLQSTQVENPLPSETMLSFTPEEHGPSVTYYTVVSAVVPRPIGLVTSLGANSPTDFSTTN